jgi:hypothetical protein
MCDAPGMPGNTIGSSGREWPYAQVALNSGTRTESAGTGRGTSASNSASCAFQAAWSIGIQPGPLSAGAPSPNENQLMLTKSPAVVLRSNAKTVCAPVG